MQYVSNRGHKQHTFLVLFIYLLRSYLPRRIYYIRRSQTRGRDPIWFTNRIARETYSVFFFRSFISQRNILNMEYGGRALIFLNVTWSPIQKIHILMTFHDAD